MEKRCDNCKFSEPSVPRGEVVECRRYPPPQPTDAGYWLFIQVKAYERCGEWRKPKRRSIFTILTMMFRKRR